MQPNNRASRPSQRRSPVPAIRAQRTRGRHILLRSLAPCRLSPQPRLLRVRGMRIRRAVQLHSRPRMLQVLRLLHLMLLRTQANSPRNLSRLRLSSLCSAMPPTIMRSARL